jgi:hypothetical protein
LEMFFNDILRGRAGVEFGTWEGVTEGVAMH